MGSKKRWKDMSRRQRVGTSALTVLQLALAVMAWVDLARRAPEDVNGSKKKWAAIIAINFVGPILYFARGRRDK
ncbi:PLDc_N domain-containing protein [Tessaracoccus rhinocerotis]|uniref:PLDc_N domain-containing protein n=1 Tax=Tessaracoccus rhinocerotis TaxID=1689449 RepID=A0A553JXX8_9ACTN|nr:PLD nuclease N-terminal domain-containing protein [Tessaracoccus rhinocerotis]TRY17309.1 PLDc_N domain-containing protein [Tessaracoccus rhinocerotis]